MAPRNLDDLARPNPACACANHAVRSCVAQLALQMKRHAYRDMIRRAAAATDGQLLDLIAAQLEDAERTKQILIARGYGLISMPASAAARLVPIAISDG